MVLKEESIEDFPLCSECWEDGFLSEYAIVTCRGLWLEHAFVVCDIRRTESEFHSDHCYCGEHIECKIFGNDERTVVYDGVKHVYSEVEDIYSYNKWEHKILEKVKINPVLNPSQELLWSSSAFICGPTCYLFKVKHEPIQYTVVFTARIELASCYDEYVKSRKLVFDQFRISEKDFSLKLMAIIRRQMYEYLCMRSFYRVTKSSKFYEPPAFVKHLEDPLSRQIIGGGWKGVNYLAVEIINNKRKPDIKLAAWVDAIGCTGNSWASMHRDLSDGTINNTVFYYKGFNISMSEDLYSITYGALYLSGPGVRSCLGLQDFHDHNSRYRFTENYFHCQAISRSPLTRSVSVSSRLEKIYGACPDERNSSYDIYCYCLTMDLSENSAVYKNHQYPNFSTLEFALQDCLDKQQSQKFLPKFINEINSCLEIQENLFLASIKQSHELITKLGAEYRQLRMSQWSRELDEELPKGASLIITFHVTQWFLDHMSNVDEGYKLLADNEFKF